jgi:hypothetical protein
MTDDYPPFELVPPEETFQKQSIKVVFVSKDLNASPRVALSLGEACFTYELTPAYTVICISSDDDDYLDDAASKALRDRARKILWSVADKQREIQKRQLTLFDESTSRKDRFLKRQRQARWWTRLMRQQLKGN